MTKTYDVLRLTTVDLAVLGVFGSLLAMELLGSPLSAGPSKFLSLLDCIDFNVGFRNRKPPAGTDKIQGSFLNYHLHSNSHSLIQTVYMYCSSVGIKYLCGMLLDYCFFGVLKPPSLSTLVMFNIALVLVHLSYKDLVFQRMNLNSSYGLLNSTGIGIFKSKKIISLVRKGIKSNLNPITLVLYVVLSMEFAGTFRSIEPIMYNLSFSKGAESIEKIVIGVLSSFDAFCDAFGAVFALTLILLHMDWALALTILPLFVYRWQRKSLAKFFQLDSDILVFDLLRNGIKDSAYTERLKNLKLEVLPSDVLLSKDQILASGTQSSDRINNFARSLSQDLMSSLETVMFQKRLDALTGVKNLKVFMKRATITQLTSMGLIVLSIVLGSIPLVFLFGAFDLFIVCGVSSLSRGGANESILRQYMLFWSFSLVALGSLFLENNIYNHKPDDLNGTKFRFHSLLFNQIRAVLVVYLSVPMPLWSSGTEIDKKEKSMGVRLSGFKKLSTAMEANVKGFLEKTMLIQENSGKVATKSVPTDDTHNEKTKQE